MRLSHYAMLGTVSALALATAPASAQQFTCGKTGGNLVFAQEAKVNSLDQMTSSTISTFTARPSPPADLTSPRDATDERRATHGSRNKISP